MANSQSGLVRVVNPKVDGTPFELDFNETETAARVLQYIRHKGVGTEEVIIGTVEHETSSGLWVAHITFTNGTTRRLDNTVRNPFAAARMLYDFRVIKRDVFETTNAVVAGGEEAVSNALDNSDKREDKRETDKASREDKRKMRAAAHRKMMQDKAAANKAAAALPDLPAATMEYIERAAVTPAAD